MSRLEADHQIAAEVGQSGNGFFTPEEGAIIAYYQCLLVSGQAYIGIPPRPFLNLGAKALLLLAGLRPGEETVLAELGSVWGFYNLESRESRSEDLDLIARGLNIQSETLAGRELLPGQKFRIYSQALFQCFPEDVSR